MNITEFAAYAGVSKAAVSRFFNGGYLSAEKKAAIAKAVEEIFGVKVAKVNTLNMQGKAKRMGYRPAGRRPSWKKAMVTLTADSKAIEFFEGMV